MKSSTNRNKTEPYAITARFNDKNYHRVLAISKKLGLTRHRALQLCYTVGIDVLSGKMDICTPAAGKADNSQQQQG